MISQGGAASCSASRFFLALLCAMVCVKQAFWWLSLIGSVALPCYSLRQQDSVFIFAYAFAWIPYIRSLLNHRRNKAGHAACAGRGQKKIRRRRTVVRTTAGKLLEEFTSSGRPAQRRLAAAH
ncbi:MAG: lipid-A-disaccharide synthase N-terminal domain-containing protein [Verrucomicrobiota bacterium]